MKTLGYGLLLFAGASVAMQAQTVALQPVAAEVSKSMPIPQYLVYRHFLAWVNDLNDKAVAAGDTDPYKFAEPFQRARLQTQDLDAILREAKALDADLKTQGETVDAVVTAYRAAARNNAQQGVGLPPAPPEIHQLQAMRTAILVQHMAHLQSALGSQKTAQLQAFLDREFAPHISLKAIGKPPGGMTPVFPAPQ